MNTLQKSYKMYYFRVGLQNVLQDYIGWIARNDSSISTLWKL